MLTSHLSGFGIETLSRTVSQAGAGFSVGLSERMIAEEAKKKEEEKKKLVMLTKEMTVGGSSGVVLTAPKMSSLDSGSVAEGRILEPVRVSGLEQRSAVQTQEKAVFQYKHNPSDNPKVLKDAEKDSHAVYGYRPKSNGSLYAFAEKDWSDREFVALARAERQRYHERNESEIMRIVQEMRSQKCTDDKIARRVVEFRNESRLNSYKDADGNITDQAGYDQAKTHCKTYESLIAEGKTDQDIIESATRGNPGMDACTGLYDDYYATYSGGK